MAVGKILIFCKKHKQFTAFFILSLLVIAVAVFAPFIATHDPYETVISNVEQRPDANHWFGTDKLGRDLFSRVIYGTRTSLASAALLVFVTLVAGSLLGILAGYFGGMADAVIMRISDMMISFPGLVLAIAIAGILGSSLMNAVIAIVAVSWTKYARLARSMVLRIKNKDYVSAAVLTGSRTGYILRKYILKMTMPILIVTAATDIGAMMLELAALSFLGFGAQPPTPEWGLMLNEGRDYLQNSPWMMFFPGLAIFIVVIIFNLLGDSLRDILDTGNN
ncbi:ABC transporter permease [Clostridium boliviensis]|uniref:ABC transporter permease n=1 Tax=Clostridium boliviensis TaxID=318465 RepID=A0ABU4GSI5_9CLOT|nr:nickel transporter permease [Clostridium boliviensis]MDW2800566.1 ABC transporter permease [Clostridium boliviensis]